MSSGIERGEREKEEEVVVSPACLSPLVQHPLGLEIDHVLELSMMVAGGALLVCGMAKIVVWVRERGYGRM